MKIVAIIFSVLLTGCELIVIGNPSTGPKVVEINQESPVGAVYLFKAELDSNNIPAASQILANPNGNYYLAYEKYEMYYDIKRLHRIISNKPITSVNIDTLSNNNRTYRFVFDYLETMSFTTKKINDEWYVVNISHWKNITNNEIKVLNNRN